MDTALLISVAAASCGLHPRAARAAAAASISGGTELLQAAGPRRLLWRRGGGLHWHREGDPAWDGQQAGCLGEAGSEAEQMPWWSRGAAPAVGLLQLPAAAWRQGCALAPLLHFGLPPEAAASSPPSCLIGPGCHFTRLAWRGKAALFTVREPNPLSG